MKHANIVTLHAAYLWKAHLWLILDLCEGGAIDDIYLDRDRGLEENEIQCIGKQVGGALDYAHSCGVFHRDIKAGNLLLQKDGTVKLADFGSCSINNLNGRKRDTFVGSPYWMAPEMVECETSNTKTTYDSKVDVWSFAITMIELADTSPPWQDLHPMRALLKIVKSEPPSVEDPHKWTEDFYDFLYVALVKDPEMRPSMSTLCDHAFLANAPGKEVLAALAGGGSLGSPPVAASPPPASAAFAQQQGMQRKAPPAKKPSVKKAAPAAAVQESYDDDWGDEDFGDDFDDNEEFDDGFGSEDDDIDLDTAMARRAAAEEEEFDEWGF